MKELEPLGHHFGAVVHGVDLAHVTDEQVAQIRAALVDRKVLFFSDQCSTMTARSRSAGGSAS
jgi:alpha-ketoglutarate-dependent taurine dioxygenase